MTVTTSIDEETVAKADRRVEELKGRGPRRRYNRSAYIEELIEADTSQGLLPTYDNPN